MLTPFRRSWKRWPEPAVHVVGHSRQRAAGAGALGREGDADRACGAGGRDRAGAVDLAPHLVDRDAGCCWAWKRRFDSNSAFVACTNRVVMAPTTVPRIASAIRSSSIV